MLYTLSHGSIEQNIIKQALRDKRPIPDKIRNAPQLFLGLELYYDAFFDLTTCRNGIGAESAISWEMIITYCNCYGLSSDQCEDMLYYIRVMDNAYLDWASKKVS